MKGKYWLLSGMLSLSMALSGTLTVLAEGADAEYTANTEYTADMESMADTEYKGFSGAAAKNKGDDNDTSNGLVNGQALLNLDSLERTYGTLDFDEIFRQVIKN